MAVQEDIATVSSACEEITKHFQQEMNRAVAGYPYDIRKFAGMLDRGEGDLDDLVDDMICDIKGYLGSKAANAVDDNQADEAIACVEAWITENISNSSAPQRIAAVYAFLGARLAYSTFNVG